jgi:hypothetical protein
MSELQSDAVHLSFGNNPELSEHFASKSAGDSGEFSSVTFQIREITETGVTLDILSVDAEADLIPTDSDSANAESIAAVMSDTNY